jgi:hypothetical protein
MRRTGFLERVSFERAVLSLVNSSAAAWQEPLSALTTAAVEGWLRANRGLVSIDRARALKQAAEVALFQGDRSCDVFDERGEMDKDNVLAELTSCFGAGRNAC